MSSAQAEPHVEVVALGRASAAALVVRAGERFSLTAIAKLTLGLRHGALVPLEPTAVRRREQHHRGSPALSIRAASELSPARPFCDVTFAGHARSPSPTRELTVRLALTRGAAVLLDKRLAVRSDKPFTALPLTYERSYGGVGYPENPLGTGFRGTTAPEITWPAGAERDGPAGLAPISATWPARRKLTGAVPWRALESGYAELAGPVPPEAFSAAPPDQRAPLLVGGEALVLEGLLEGAHELCVTLPTVRGVALFVPAGERAGRGAELALTLDGVHVDGDAGVIELTLRGDLATSRAALEGGKLAVAVELAGERLPERALHEACRAGSVERSPRTAASAPALGGTVRLGDEGSRPEGRDQRVDATRAEGPGDAHERGPASLPFPKPSRPERRASGDALPGAPWSHEASLAVPRADAALTETVALEPEPTGEAADSLDARAAVDPGAEARADATPTRPAEPPPHAPSQARTADPWRQEPAAPPPAPSAPERPPPFVAPRISVGGALYGKRKP